MLMRDAGAGQLIRCFQNFHFEHLSYVLVRQMQHEREAINLLILKEQYFPICFHSRREWSSGSVHRDGCSVSRA